MVTVFAIMLPLALITGICEGCQKLPEKMQERHQMSMYRREHRTIWN